MKNSGLGKGIGALMGDDLAELNISTEIDREYIHNIPISKIDVNKSQPRKTFNKETIAALAESIKANGMLQPITVHKCGERYEIVAGERRFRACRMLKMESIPAIVKELSPRQVCELALIENLQREDLNPIEEALAIRSLMTDFSLTQQEVATRIGSSRPAIANAVRLLALPKEVIDLISSGQLSAGHGRTLAVIEDKTLLVSLAQSCASQGWSVRETEKRVKSAMSAPKKKQEKKRSPEFDRIEDELRRSVGTKVRINGSQKKGKIEIEYFSRDDLERIIAIMAPKGDF